MLFIYIYVFCMGLVYIQIIMIMCKFILKVCTIHIMYEQMFTAVMYYCFSCIVNNK